MIDILSSLFLDISLGAVIADGNNYIVPRGIPELFSFGSSGFIENSSLIYDYLHNNTDELLRALNIKGFKLTLVNPAITLSAISREGGALQSGSTTPLAPGGLMTLTGTASGHTRLVYKIVREVNGERAIVGYGMGDAGSVAVEAKDFNGNNLVQNGDYTLYVWAQKDNAINSDEGSVPMHIKLDVGSRAYVPAAALASQATPASQAPSANEISVIIDGESLAFDIPPQIVNGRILVPLRTIFEKMGATVVWDGATQTVTATKDDKVVVLSIGDTSPTVNGEAVSIDQPGVILDGRTLAPLRFVAQAFGGTVVWDDATNTAYITR